MIESVDLSGCIVLEGIGDYGFAYCSQLVDITFPETATFTTLGWEAFTYCTCLQRIDLSKTALEDLYGSRIFYGCESLISVLFPETCTGIYGSYMFADCVSLTEFNFEYIEYISAGECFANTGFTTLKFDNANINFTDSYAVFARCENLVSVDMSGSAITILEGNMFEECIQLVTANLDNGVMISLGDGTFMGCASLHDVTFASTLEHVGHNVFQNCVELEEIDLSLTQVTKFSEGMHYEGTVDDVNEFTASYVFDGCIKLSSVLLPREFSQIGGYAFSGCVSLETLDLSTVTRIGSSAFVGSGIKQIDLSSLIDLIMDGDTSPFDECPIEKVELGDNTNFKLEADYEGSGYTALTNEDGTIVYFKFLPIKDEE